MKKALIDTNILSAFMRGNGAVRCKFEQYLQIHNTLTISVITYYEIMRGIKSLSNPRKMEAFQEFMSVCEIEEIDSDVAEQAADIYDTLRREGELIEDADILIASTALSRGLSVVTDNEKHFNHISGITIENWLDKNDD